jgi:hypothetical protein
MIEYLPNALVNVYFLGFVEVLLIPLALWLAYVCPEYSITVEQKLFRAFENITRRPRFAILLVGLVAFMGSLGVSLFVRFPLPAIHDEFSYLLAADTFVHGRLTNPTHPFWKHFEAIHVLQQPTYVSKYPPAQGLMLALGQILGGHSVVGVWLGIALACGAITWMLQGWVPRRWALLGGLIAALNLGFFGYWSQNYWGGALAATGGALLFGALRRLIRRPAPGGSISLGIGLVILANSRPLEGLIASLPVIMVIITAIFKRTRWPWGTWLYRVVVPTLLIVLAGMIFMAYYNLQVTGSPWRMPYQVHEREYPTSPIFLWASKPSSPRASVPQIFLDLNHVLIQRQQEMQTASGFIKTKSEALLNMALFHFRTVLLVPLIMVPWVLRNRWNAFAFLVILLVTAIVLLETQSYPRKLAPVTCLLILLAVQALRHLRVRLWHGRPIGRCLAGLLVTILLVSVAISFLPIFRADSWVVSLKRAQIEGQLQKDGDRHLILVGNNHYYYYPHFDWVHNRADIDTAKVIWARDLGPTENQKLIDYFNERKIWRLDVARLDKYNMPLESLDLKR